MNLELAIERVAALFYLIMGISLMVRPKIWLNYIDEIQKDKPTPNAYALVHLLLGLVIIVFHNIWSFDPSVIITFVGYGVVLKMVIFLLFPKFLIGLTPKGAQLTKSVRIEGVVFTILMVWVLCRNYLIVGAL